MTERQRQALYLKQTCGLDAREIARRLGISSSAAFRLLARAEGRFGQYRRSYHRTPHRRVLRAQRLGGACDA